MAWAGPDFRACRGADPQRDRSISALTVKRTSVLALGMSFLTLADLDQSPNVRLGRRQAGRFEDRGEQPSGHIDTGQEGKSDFFG